MMKLHSTREHGNGIHESFKGNFIYSRCLYCFIIHCLPPAPTSSPPHSPPIFLFTQQPSQGGIFHETYWLLIDSPLFDSLIPWLFHFFHFYLSVSCCMCVCACMCVSVRSSHSGQWPLGHHGQHSSTPTEEVRKCLAWGSDKDSHPSFLSLSLRISTPYNILPIRTDVMLHWMEMGEQNDLW